MADTKQELTDTQKVNLLVNTLFAIRGVIGNVDHSKGNGENSAKLRGYMLNDIRTLMNATLNNIGR